MRIIWAFVAIAASCMPPLEALAFDRCDKLFATPGKLQDFIYEQGVRDAPMKYFDQARLIRIETEDTGRLFPFAKLDPNGKPVVVYPSAFPPLLCRMALVTYLDLEDKSERRPFAEAARDAARCVDSKQLRDICLTNYANDLEQRYRASFEALTGQLQESAYGIATDALGQIAKHEYAHILLSHAQRIRSGGIARIDAEFEADFYAIQNGVQSDGAPSAMFYFFKPLADTESYTEVLSSPDYESSSCRAENAQVITWVFGTAPMFLLDAVGAGENGSLELRREAEKLNRELPPLPRTESCGRLSEVVLRQAHGELTSLVALVAEYADLLPASQSKKGLEEALGYGLSAPKIFELIDRLQVLSQSFTQLNGLAARALSILVSRVGLAGMESEVSRQLDRAVQSSIDNIHAGDYGRMLKVKGLTALYRTPDGPLEVRMDEAQRLFERSVVLQPALAESWMNLAFIAYARGDCIKAAELADKAAGVADDAYRGETEEFRDRVRKDAASGRCKEEADAFASTFAR